MRTITLTRQIDAPPATVFAFATDLERMAGRIKGITKIEKLTPGPVGLGTKFKETRVMFGREATETMEFTAFEPNQRYTLSADSCGAHFDSTFHFKPEGSGTLLTLEMQLEATSFFAKLMKPLTMLMMGPMKKCIMQDMDDLKASAEAAVQAGDAVRA